MERSEADGEKIRSRLSNKYLKFNAEHFGPDGGGSSDSSIQLGRPITNEYDGKV